MDDSNRATPSASDHGRSSGSPRYLRWLVPVSVLMLLLLTLLLALDFRMLVYGSQSIADASKDVAWQTARERETTLRQDLTLLQEQWLGRQAQCPIVAARLPELGPVPITPPFPLPQPPQPPQPPEQETTPTTPPSPGPTAEGPEWDGRLTPPPPVPKPPVPRKPNTRLVIPSQTENMEFLNGCWRSVTNLFDNRDKKPIQHEYCFDNSGEGEVTVRSKRFICKGNISAAMQGSKTLIIKTLDQALSCNNQSSFGGWQVICQSQANGKAVCRGINYSDNTRFDVTLLRK